MEREGVRGGGHGDRRRGGRGGSIQYINCSMDAFGCGLITTFSIFCMIVLQFCVHFICF